MSETEIRAATVDDLIALFGKPPARTMRALACVQNGRVVGALGIVYQSGGQPPYLFSDIAPDAERNPLAIVRAARAALAAFVTGPIQAIANPKEPGSSRLLTWLGFRHFGASEHGQVYVYEPPGRSVDVH